MEAIPAVANELLMITKIFLRSLKQSKQLSDITIKTVNVYAHFLERFPIEFEKLSSFSRDCHSAEFVESFIQQNNLDSCLSSVSHSPFGSLQELQVVETPRTDQDSQNIEVVVVPQQAEPVVVVSDSKLIPKHSINLPLLSLPTFDTVIETTRKSDEIVTNLTRIASVSSFNGITEKPTNNEVYLSTETNLLISAKPFIRQEAPRIDYREQELMTTAFLKELSAKSYQPTTPVIDYKNPSLINITTPTINNNHVQLAPATSLNSVNHQVSYPLSHKYNINSTTSKEYTAPSFQTISAPFLPENDLSNHQKTAYNGFIPSISFTNISSQPSNHLASKYGIISQLNPSNHQYEFNSSTTLPVLPIISSQPLRTQMMGDIPTIIQPKFNPKGLLEDVRQQIVIMKNHDKLFKQLSENQQNETKTHMTKLDLNIPNLAKQKIQGGNLAFDLFHQMKTSLKNIVVYAHKDQRKASMFRIENDLQQQKKQIKESFAQYQIKVQRDNSKIDTPKKNNRNKSAFNSPLNKQSKQNSDLPHFQEANPQTLSSKYMLEKVKSQLENNIQPNPPIQQINWKSHTEMNDQRYYPNNNTNPFPYQKYSEPNEVYSYKDNDFSSFVNSIPVPVPIPQNNLLSGAISPSNNNTNNNNHNYNNYLLSDSKTPQAKEHLPFYQNSNYQLNGNNSNSQNNQKYHLSRHLYIEDQKIY